MDFNETVERVGQTVDGIGVAITVVGMTWALVSSSLRVLRKQCTSEEGYIELRRKLGRSVLLGLEILVAGDIIRTVAVTPSFTSVAVLGIIVVIRTFLSMTLEVEINSRWPWQKPRPAAPVPAPSPAQRE
jgi:uncharacterized membrane protein